MRAALAVILWAALLDAVRPSGDVTTYTPVEIKVPTGSGNTKLEVAVPHRGEIRPSNPRELMNHVTNAWDQVVEQNQVMSSSELNP